MMPQGQAYENYDSWRERMIIDTPVELAYLLLFSIDDNNFGEYVQSCHTIFSNSTELPESLAPLENPGEA